MKRIKYLIITLICFFGFSIYGYASSVSISGNTSVTKGNSVSITASVSSDTPLVSIEGTFMCKGSGISEGVDMVFDDSSNSVKSKSYTITIRPTTSGTITCSTSGVRITNMSSDSWQNLDNKSLTINVKEPVVVPPKTYSSNNKLKGLSIEGYTLSPEFSSDVLEYVLEVPNDVRKINISAEKDDSKATISGTGEKDLEEGINKLEIKVEAENGNVKVYTINVTVKELDPIEVTINKNKYTVIRKEGILDIPTNYEKSSIKIDDQDVLCYKNDKTDTTLVGLTNDKGESAYYIYESGKYSKYNSISINGTSMKLLDMPKENIPEGYKKVSFEYDNNKIEGYQYVKKGVTYAASNKVKGSPFYLVYAENEETGKKGIYMYDSEEKTLQRYNEDITSYYENKLNNTRLYLYISLFLVVVLLVTLIIIITKKNKKRR